MTTLSSAARKPSAPCLVSAVTTTTPPRAAISTPLASTALSGSWPELRIRMTEVSEAGARELLQMDRYRQFSDIPVSSTYIDMINHVHQFRQKITVNLHPMSLRGEKTSIWDEGWSYS